MQIVSDLWTYLWENPRHEEEVKLVIAGTEYTQSEIIADSLKIYGGIFSGFGIGNCASRQMDVEILPKGDIPKQAKLEVFKRLVFEEQTSEWVKQGEFLVSTRQGNKATGSTKFHCFDAMLKASEKWLTSAYDYDTWPKTEIEAVNDIAARMGIEVDNRSDFDNIFPVEYPVDENAELAMLDVLGMIALVNAGNFVITNEGKLRLLKIGEEPMESNYLVSENGYIIRFGDVALDV